MSRQVDQADMARGARVELLIEAIESGRKARALGMWAGMSVEERAEFGPLIWALMGQTGGAR
ncbi:hypothetical protein [Actinocrinis sp.]|uniref:hypothetical protein n=1 Tax=Actinocrinis sp. TaxID=1920516 RepID=UPI002D75FC84|nr:hypothetical protein [Actinocrinis sp.]HZP54443.1 hypothetical protein [Actinocrinis sp.]